MLSDLAFQKRRLVDIADPDQMLEILDRLCHNGGMNISACEFRLNVSGEPFDIGLTLSFGNIQQAWQDTPGLHRDQSEFVHKRDRVNPLGTGKSTHVGANKRIRVGECSFILNLPNQFIQFLGQDLTVWISIRSRIKRLQCSETFPDTQLRVKFEQKIANTGQDPQGRCQVRVLRVFGNASS